MHIYWKPTQEVSTKTLVHKQKYSYLHWFEKPTGIRTTWGQTAVNIVKLHVIVEAREKYMDIVAGVESECLSAVNEIWRCLFCV